MAHLRVQGAWCPVQQTSSLSLTPSPPRASLPSQGSTADCKSLTDYLPPSPGVGCHRFIFLLFKGAIPLVKSDERICWDVAKFMNVHPNLVPVAMDCAFDYAPAPISLLTPSLTALLLTVMYVTSV